MFICQILKEYAWCINKPRWQICRCCTFVHTDKDNYNAYYKMGISYRLNIIRSVSKCTQSSDYIALFACITSFEFLPFRLHCNQTCDYWYSGTIELRTPPHGEVAAVTVKLYDRPIDSLNMTTTAHTATMYSGRLRFRALAICSKYIGFSTWNVLMYQGIIYLMFPS